MGLPPEEKYNDGRFNRALDIAHGDYVRWERKVGRHSSIAVRAARFHHFIKRGDYPELLLIDPDTCEKYLVRIDDMQRQTGAASKDELGGIIRRMALRIAHREFRKEHNSNHSDEITAFQDFIAMKHPEYAIPDDEEVQQVINDEKRHRRFLVGAMAISTMSIAALISIFTGPCTTPAKIREKDKPVAPIKRQDDPWMERTRPFEDREDGDRTRSL